MDVMVHVGYGKAAIWGLLAGIAMAIATMMITAAVGMGFWTMLLLIAGIVLGPSAMMGGVSLGVLLIGAIIHMALSMMFGVIYAAIVNSVTREIMLTAVVFGLALWIVNFYVLGLVLPGARMMAQHEPTWLAILSHLVFGLTLGGLSRTSASAATTAIRA
jgi:hypothetical protein